MVKEVVPLSKKHLAIGVVTFQYLYVSLSSWIFILVNSKLSSLRNAFLNFDSIEVETVTLFNVYESSGWNFISDPSITYLGPLNKLSFVFLFLFVRGIKHAAMEIHEAHLSLSFLSKQTWFRSLKVGYEGLGSNGAKEGLLSTSSS